MSETAWIITRIEAHQRQGDVEGFDLYFFLDGPAGERCLQVPPIAMLSYGQFQAMALERLGILYRYALAEGRDPFASDEAWKTLCSGIRIVPAPSAAPSN